jgi:hypothetical protein
MNRWIDRAEAAEQLGVALPTLRKLLNSTNPPPYMRPSERSILFDPEALARWQQTWKRAGEPA